MKKNGANFQWIKEPSSLTRILISAPHVGITFPAELVSQFMPRATQFPQDTDWYVHELYRSWVLASDHAAMIRAELSRYIVDLNRDPNGIALYNDGRSETGIVPSKEFSGRALYRSECLPLTEAQLKDRIRNYFDPYHSEISNTLMSLGSSLEKPSLLVDVHSIARLVPSIRTTAFPDIILGSNDHRSSSSSFVEKAASILKREGYEVAINDPFKGGFITRKFGNPHMGLHAVQIEMSQDLYMDDAHVGWRPQRASRIEKALSLVLSSWQSLLLNQDF